MVIDEYDQGEVSISGPGGPQGTLPVIRFRAKGRVKFQTRGPAIKSAPPKHRVVTLSFSLSVSPALDGLPPLICWYGNTTSSVSSIPFSSIFPSSKPGYLLSNVEPCPFARPLHRAETLPVVLMSFDPSGCTLENVEALSAKHFRWLQSVYLACIGYGIVVTLFFMCTYLILQSIYTRIRRIASSGERYNAPPINCYCFSVPGWRVRVWMEAFSLRTVVLLVYVLAMTTLSTLTIVSTMKATNNALVWRGCWDGVTTVKTSLALDAMGNYAYVLANWGADGILVWRCWVLYRGSSTVPVWAALAIPLCLYLSVIGLGLSFMVPNRTLATTRVLEVVYSCLTLALNVVVTCLISFRLLFFRRQVKTVMGKTQNTQYIGIVAMLIESAALVAIFNVFSVATISTQSLFRYIAFAGNVQSQVIAPLLIIVRVLQGTAWTEQGSQNPADNFKFASYAGSSVFDRGATLSPGEATTSLTRTHSREDGFDGKPEHLLSNDRRRDLSVEMSRISRDA